MEYLNTNRNFWNAATDVNFESDFYDQKTFEDGRNSLNSIELDLLGDVKGKSILHLQCHFGQDSLSLQRMGAQVTGVDLSDAAISKAKALNEQLGLNAEFICNDVYSLNEVLNKQYDIVFTSYGTIAWLPDLDRWAQVIEQHLKPEGNFIFAEFHPAVWMWDDDFTKITYHYLNKEVIADVEEGTYANKEAGTRNAFMCWNHGIGEVATALLNKGIRIEALQEFDYSPYPSFKDCEEFEPGKFRVKHFGNKMPLVYAIKGRKTRS